MNCEPYLTLISGHIDGENTDEEELQLQRHLDECPHCRDLLAEYEAIDLGVASLSAEPPEELLRGVMAGLRPGNGRRRFIFGGGTLAAAVIVLAVILPGLLGDRKEDVPSPAALSALPVETGDADAQNDADNRPMLRSAEAQFVTMAEPIVIEITDDPDCPAAQNIAILEQMPCAMVDGVPEYYVDADAAREIVDAGSRYDAIVPAELDSAADDAPCIVRIVPNQ